MKIKSLLACAMVAYTVVNSSAYAQDFTLEQTYSSLSSIDKLVVDVSFSGTLSGNVVSNITNATESYTVNGGAATNVGSVNVYSFDSTYYYISSGASVGFGLNNTAQDNIVFTTASLNTINRSREHDQVYSMAGADNMNNPGTETVDAYATFDHGRTGLPWADSYYSTLWGGGNDLQVPNGSYTTNISFTQDVTTAAAVPEPETYAMFAVGLLGLSLARKKTVQA